jgi:MFS family permease
VFIAASVASRDSAAGSAEGSFASMVAFASLAAGGLGCVWGGLVADRLGREWLVTVAMAASGACALVIGLTFGMSPWLLVPVALAWGFFVVADSAQFSAVVTEVAPSHAVGTALTLQTSLGFLLTAVSIWLAVEVSSRVGWGAAFSLLALGPAFGIASMVRLKIIRFRTEPIPEKIGARQNR